MDAQCRQTHRMWRGPATLALGVVLSVPGGCQKPEPPPAAYMGPTLASLELGAERLPADPTGFVLLSQEPSVGRFPNALAVARLEPPQGGFAPEDLGEGPRENWWVRTIRWEEAMNWNRLCNTVPSIREVIVLDRFTTVRPDARPEEITVSARRLEAGLCLVYGPSPAEAGYAGLWGVIADTASNTRVAFVQAQAGPKDFQPPPADRPSEDLRHVDPNYLAERKFQQEVRKCLLALIAMDSPPATTQPSPWRTDAPAAMQPVIVVPERVGRW